MDIQVSKFKNLDIEKNFNTQNENEVNLIKLTVPEEYQDFNKKIVFITDDGIYWDLFENDEYILKKAITKYKSVKFYIWLTKDNQDFRSETRKITFYENKDASQEITDEEISGVNTVIKLLEDEIKKVTDLIDDVNEKVENGEFDGYTPIRGIDYWTPLDKQEIVDEAKSGIYAPVVENEKLIFNTLLKVVGEELIF